MQFLKNLPLLSVLFLVGCSVNPVTGKREIMMVSTEQQIEMGRANYVPMQQSQGGPYDVDPELVRYVQEVGARVAQPQRLGATRRQDCDQPRPFDGVTVRGGAGCRVGA
jgi:predicted Zn-dependent protease